MAKTQSFTDKDGNRFIVPSFVIYPEDDDAPSGYDITCKAMTFSLALGSDVSLDKDWFEFDENNFPHVSTELRSNRFFHGACTTCVFEGPLFDEAMKEHKN